MSAVYVWAKFLPREFQWSLSIVGVQGNHYALAKVAIKVCSVSFTLAAHNIAYFETLH